MRREVVVVGAGLAGLAAAWELRDRDILVLEVEQRVGGRIRSESRGAYWLNWGAHVFGDADSAAGRLICEVGLESVAVPGVLTAVSLGDRVLAQGRVETFPLRLPLALRERAALGRAGARLRVAVRRYDRAVRRRAGESEDERQARTLAFMGERSFADFLGAAPPAVESLFRPTITRSSAEPEQLAAGHGVGYFHLVWRPGHGLSRNLLGGSSLLTEGIANALRERVTTRARVTEVLQGADGVRVRYVRDGEERTLEAEQAVVATPAYVTADIVRDLAAETLAALRRIPYGPYVVVSFRTHETTAQPWDDIYALATPGRSFNMIFNLANVLRAREQTRAPGGSLMVYSGGERLAGPLLEREDDEIVETYLRDLDAVFPGIRDLVAEAVVQRWPRALPYPFPGRHLLQDALTQPLGLVHLAGDYMGSWYTETAVRTGRAAARTALAALARK